MRRFPGKTGLKRFDPSEFFHHFDSTPCGNDEKSSILPGSHEIAIRASRAKNRDAAITTGTQLVLPSISVQRTLRGDSAQFGESSDS